MIGAVLITHGGIAASLVEAAASITGEVQNVGIVSVQNTDATEKIRDELAASIKEVDAGKGVIIFTDMFGGTPTNVALSLLKDGEVEVLTGVNLPLLVKFVGNRADKPLSELVEALKGYGRESIVLAGDMLREKDGKEAGG